MVMPSCEGCDFLLAYWANPVLFFPQVEQLPFAMQSIDHLHTESFLKVDFPCWIERIGITANLSMTTNRHPTSGEKCHHSIIKFTAEHPIAPVDRFEVF